MKSKKNLSEFPQLKAAGKYNSKKENSFRSGLEAYCSKRLKEEEIRFEYEPFKIELLPAFQTRLVSFEPHKKTIRKTTNKVRSMTYTPDFVGENWIIETKGRKTPDFSLKWKLLKHKYRDRNYTLFLPSNQKQVEEVIEIIKNGDLLG